MWTNLLHLFNSGLDPPIDCNYIEQVLKLKIYLQNISYKYVCTPWWNNKKVWWNQFLGISTEWRELPELPKRWSRGLSWRSGQGPRWEGPADVAAPEMVNIFSFICLCPDRFYLKFLSLPLSSFLFPLLFNFFFDTFFNTIDLLTKIGYNSFLANCSQVLRHQVILYFFFSF